MEIKTPITRKKLAKICGISTKTLSRYMADSNINIKPRTLINPSIAKAIVSRYVCV